MPTLRFVLVVTVAVIGCGAAAQAQKSDPGPLTIRSQGSFFVGGEKKNLPTPQGPGAAFGGGEIMVNQMYVQYQVPMRGERHVPVVMIHGCCLSSKTWETTPDGRMGWDEYFVRKDRSVYLADQVSRARSGFDATVINAVKSGAQPPSALPDVIAASHQIAWSVFRFGPTFGQPFADGQFPIEAADDLYKQMIPDLNALLPADNNPTWANMAALAKQLNGAVLMGHSESGFFPQQAALIDASGIKGMISIEQPCPEMTAPQVAALAKIPTLMVFGDHLGDVQTGGLVNWQTAHDSCLALVDKMKAAGGDAQMMHLPSLGIKGNSHMLMQDKNSDQIADLVIAWIDEHVERR
jgi:hypothetical protein